MRSLLDAMTDAPAFVRNGRLDILAANQLGRPLYAPAFDSPARPVNVARFCFLHPRAPTAPLPAPRAATPYACSPAGPQPAHPPTLRQTSAERRPANHLVR